MSGFVYFDIIHTRSAELFEAFTASTGRFKAPADGVACRRSFQTLVAIWHNFFESEPARARVIYPVGLIVLAASGGC